MLFYRKHLHYDQLKVLLCFLAMLPFFGFSQSAVSGKVVSMADGKPVTGANVFLNGATIGTSTNADGTFTLKVSRGQYDLVVSCVGYETFFQKAVVDNASLSLPEIKLAVKITELKEVKITQPDPYRAQYLAAFIQAFLGRSANAQKCRILNTDAINISFNRAKNMLTASSDDFLEIENKALGYKLYYQLNQFSKKYNMTYYAGPVWFEEMKGTPAQQKRWLEKREEIYRGSSMHFLRSVFEHRFSQEGFKAFRLVSKPNPARPPDSLLRTMLRKYKVGSKDHPDWRDSAGYYRDKMRLPEYTEYLITTPLKETDFAHPVAGTGAMSLQFQDHLYVIYFRQKGSTQHVNIGALPNAPNNPSTLVTLAAKQALFDGNGILDNPGDALFDGVWGTSAVAEMLPVNYMP